MSCCRIVRYGVCLVVGLLWFVHYGMMHYVERLTPVLNVINNTVSVCVCVCVCVCIQYVRMCVHTVCYRIFELKFQLGGRGSLWYVVCVLVYVHISISNMTVIFTIADLVSGWRNTFCVWNAWYICRCCKQLVCAFTGYHVVAMCCCHVAIIPLMLLLL